MNNQKTISSNLSDSLPNSIEDNNKLKNYNSTKLSKNINNNEKRQNTIIEISSSKKYNKSNGRNQILEEILNLNEKIKQNENELNDIKTNLINLKQEKKKKQEDIVNLLSNKESIEEIYKNQIYFLINSNSINEENINNEKMKDKSAIFDVGLNDIKESEKSQYIEQIKNMINDIFKNNDTIDNKELLNIVDNSYKLLNENNSENNNDLIIKEFFFKISLYISNQSSSRFQESDINLLLRYLLLINSINRKIEIYLKFVNKKYKEQKKELNNSCHELEKKIKDFKDKKVELELQLKDYENKNSESNNLSLENENKENNNKLINDKGKDNKIIYSKKNISKNNNFFIKSKRNNTKEKIDNKNENVFINKNLEKDFKENKLNKNLIIDYENEINKNELINYEKENELKNRDIDKYKNEEENKQDEYKYNNNINRKKNGNVVYLEEKRKIDRRTLLKKINDYTFNISINSNNKRIFTENNSKTNITENKKENNKINNIGEKERNGSINQYINNRIKNDINFARKINYYEKCKSQNEEIITYKISSISKNQLQEISNNMINCKDIQKDDILSNYNSSNLLKRKSDSNRIISNNCLTNSDEKNHNYISIINITNNAPIQNKQMTIGEEEKIYNIDNFENENCDDLKINTLKIKNNILNEIDENNDFDINNNNYFLTKEIEENHDDIKKIKKINNNNKKSVNSKSIYKIDLTKYLNKNSEINDINEERSNDRNLTINITSLDNKNANYQYHNIYDSNLSSSNQIFSNANNNTLSPSKRHKCDFKNKNNFFNNVDDSTTLKVTKTKEVDLKEIKNNKLNDILNGRKLSKSLISNNIKIGKAKLLSNSRDKVQNNENKNSKEKLNKINDKINKGKVTSQGSNSLNKMKKNNLSLDKI